MTSLDYEPDDDDVRRFRAEGYLVTPRLFDDATLGDVRRAIEARWEACNAQIAASGARGAASKADYSRARPELPRLHFDSDVLAAFCRHPQLARIAGRLIGPDADLSWNQAYAKAPSGDPRTEIPWHQDGYYAEVDGTTYNCWVAITPTTVANGTIVRAPLPSSADLLPHAWDERLLFYACEIDEATATPIELEPGQAFLFAGRVPHRSGPNVSAGTRVSYSISFTSVDARLRANGETFGDRVPILRGGRYVDALLAEYVRAGRPQEHPGARVVAEITARAPTRTAEAGAALDAFADAVATGDAENATRHAGRLLSLLPDSQEALGDLVRARARVDQLERELAAVRRTDPRVERLLVERMLELDPGHSLARSELARLVGDQRGTK